MEMHEIPVEDRETIRESLLARKAEGVERPLIPLNVDIDGDGICDAFGLNALGALVLVSGASLADTVWESDGDDIVSAESDG